MAFCAAWKQSGLTKMKFCRENNLSKRTFHTWIKQFQSNDNSKIANAASSESETVIKTDPIKFLKVRHAIPSRNFSLAPSSLEIFLANGAVLKAAMPQENLNNFLQEILKWK